MLGKRLLVLLVFVSLAQLVVSEKLELNAKKLSANVSVSAEQLDLKIVPGPKTDYSPKKEFGLVIGGCVAQIIAGLFDTQTNFAIKVGNKHQSVISFSGISVTNISLKFTGFYNNGEPIKDPIECDVDFEPIDGKFMVKLALTGSVPPNFNVTSEAELYGEKKEEVSKAGLKLILGISLPLLGLAILMSVSAVVGFLIQRRRKNKAALSEERANLKRLNDAKLAGEQLAAEQAKLEPVKNKQVEAQKESNSEKKSKASSSNASLKAKKDGNEKGKQSKAKDDGSDKTKQSKVGSINKNSKSAQGFSINTADLDFGPARVLSTVEGDAELRKGGYTV
jgi:hypothetical protein